MENHMYSGDIVAGSLLMSESRKLADLLLQGLNEKQIRSEVIVGNVLQKRSPVSARRQARLILNRLLPLHEDFWFMIRDGSHEQALQTLLAASVAQSRLLAGFLKQVIRVQRSTFQRQVSFKEWDSYFEECMQHDPEIANWAESTTKKIRQVVFRILAEAKIIDSTRNMNLIPFYLLPEVKELLEKHEQHYTLDCLEAIQ